MPSLGMAQDTGKLIAWLKAEGETVSKGDPIMEIETDKATVEIESPGSGILSAVTARPGDEVPVGQVIAWILAPGEAPPGGQTLPAPSPHAFAIAAPPVPVPAAASAPAAALPPAAAPLEVSPIARRMAQEHGLNLSLVKPDGGRIEKKDVLAYLERQSASRPSARLQPASPKARRLAGEFGLDLAAIPGSGPESAVLAADVVAASQAVSAVAAPAAFAAASADSPSGQPNESYLPVSNVWRIMAERLSDTWPAVPHFYLVRDVYAGRLVEWRRSVQARLEAKITITDLLVRLAAAALRRHPRLLARWDAGRILQTQAIHIGLAVAIEDGLTVPVIHHADQMDLRQIAARRSELVERAQSGRLRLEDLADGAFTISNLGMYAVDAFNAIINPPQAAILAVGRIADRVVPLDGQPAVRPMLTLTLSCDHRVVDGARGAQFLQTLASYIEDPLAVLD